MSERRAVVRPWADIAYSLQELQMTLHTKAATVWATVLTNLAAALAATIATSVVPTPTNAAENQTMTQMPKPVKSGHEAVNGVNYYYAVYGKGEPLLLLHGGLGQIEMFGPNLATLAQHREVIGVDLHGHGRTDLGNRDI